MMPLSNPPWYRDSLRHSLKTALTHSSYLNEHADEGLESNERLEFLGDAVLGLVIANELYTKYPDLQEGALTQIRANVVNTKTLARVARNLKLGENLLFGSGEEKTGGAERDSNLANAFEAVVAAIRIGNGNNGYNAARDFCLRVLREEIDHAHHEVTSAPKQTAKSDSVKKQNQSPKSKTPNTAGKHPKSALQEIVQAKYGVTPEYRSDKPEGKSHQPTFTTRVYVKGKAISTGKGNGKKAAETEAANAALKTLMNTG
ncbi:MAG: ribonuclease III [Chloroflexi bacterium]|nr:ribonuclease III [Chloroflexota bacterium]